MGATLPRARCAAVDVRRETIEKISHSADNASMSRSSPPSSGPIDVQAILAEVEALARLAERAAAPVQAPAPGHQPAQVPTSGGAPWDAAAAARATDLAASAGAEGTGSRGHQGTRQVAADQSRTHEIDLKRELDDALEDGNQAVIRASSGVIHEAIHPVAGDLASAARGDARPDLVFDTNALVTGGEDVSRALLETFGAERPGRSAVDDAFVSNPVPAFDGSSTIVPPERIADRGSASLHDDDPGRTARAIPIAAPAARDLKNAAESAIPAPATRASEAAVGSISRVPAPPEADVEVRAGTRPDADGDADEVSDGGAHGETDTHDAIDGSGVESGVESGEHRAGTPAHAAIERPRRRGLGALLASLGVLASIPLRIAAFPMRLLPAQARVLASILAASMLVAAPLAWLLAWRATSRQGVGPIEFAPAPAQEPASPDAPARVDAQAGRDPDAPAGERR